MGYPIQYKDINVQNCETATTAIIREETSSTTTGGGTIQTSSTSQLSRNNFIFEPPTCSNGAIGTSCNITSDQCAMTQPCFNLATCYPNVSMPLGYECSWVLGFSSVNWEVDERLCRLGLSCLNGGTCHGSQCVCPTGKTGDHCEYEVDTCTFACVAIGCIATVIGFVLIMDALKYFFNIDPIDYDISSSKKRTK